MLAQMEAYWAALPRAGTVPRRADVDPRGVEQLLANAVILERVAPGVARFRIAGGHLTDLAGMEVRGMPVTALFAASSRPDMGAALTDLFDRPAIVQARLTGEPGRFARAVRGQMLLLPLCLENGEVSRAMGAVITDATAGSDPQKLTLSDLTIRPLSPAGYSAEPEAAGAFAEETKPLTGSPPRLRIVHSAD